METRKSVSSGKKKTPITFSLTIVQCLACAVVLLLALILRLIGGKPFDTLRSLFKQAITDTTITETISETLSPAVGGTNLVLAEPNITTLPESVSTEPFVADEQAVLPIPMGKITSSFGYRTDPFTKELGFHTGVDIGAPKGTEIMAVYDGIVIRADNNASYGNYLIIQHHNGAQTLYAHCSALHKTKGNRVSAGEVVAEVGSTGNSTGNHLHWELKQEGMYHNPLSILKEHPYA